MGLIDSVNNLENVQMHSAHFGQSLLLEEMRHALKNKDMESLDRILASGGVNTTMTPSGLKELKTNILGCDWVEGFERVVAHYKISLSSEGSPGERSIIEEAAQHSEFWLMDHLWDKTPRDIQERCIENHQGLGLAIILGKRREAERLRDPKKKWILARCLSLLSEANHPEDRQSVKEVVKGLVKTGESPLNIALWKSMCELDDVVLLKELVREGIIKEANLVLKASMAELLKGCVPTTTRRLSGEWFIENDGRGETWSQKGAVEHSWSLAELICVLSDHQHKPLGSLMAHEEFREAVLSSDMAREAFVRVCCESDFGLSLLKEAKSQGLDVSRLMVGGQMTPLHVLASTYSDMEQDSKGALFLEMIKLQPEWASSRDAQSRIPADLLKGASAEQLVSVCEEWILGHELSKKGKKNSPVKSAALNPHRV